MVDLTKITARDLEREKAKRYFERFVSYTKPDYRFNWHHRHLCQKLQDFAEGKITHLMVFMPPRHGKSELVSRRFPAWLLGRNPNLQIIAASYSDALATRMNRDVQRIIDSPSFKELFPQTTLEGSNVRTVADGKFLRNADLFEIVGHRGSYRSAGIGAGLTGMGADVGLIDDPIKDQKEADSRTYREALWEWFGSVFETRLENAGRVLITLTRWHEDDLAGRILQMAKADPLAQQYEIVQFPAICEDELNPDDPREIGAALWPEKYPIEVLEKRKKTLGTRRFAALFQQAPTPAEGSIIKRAWCGQFWRELPARVDEYLISADLTFKDAATSDYVVFQVWARAQGQYFLIDELRDRMDFPTSISAFETVIGKHPQAFVKLIEDKANGPALIAQLKKKIPGLIAFNPQGSKDERLSAVSPAFEAGNVWLPHPEKAPWVFDFVEELCTNGAHDDRKDACSMALLRFMGPVSADFGDEPPLSNQQTIAGPLQEKTLW